MASKSHIMIIQKKSKLNFLKRNEKCTEKKQIKLKLNNEKTESIISKIIEKNSRKKPNNPTTETKKIFKSIKPSKELSLYDICKENVSKTEKIINKVVLDINSKDFVPKNKRVHLF